MNKWQNIALLIITVALAVSLVASIFLPYVAPAWGVTIAFDSALFNTLAALLTGLISGLLHSSATQSIENHNDPPKS